MLKILMKTDFQQRLRDHNPVTDPWTNQVVSGNDLIPNIDLRAAIEDYKLHALQFSIPVRMIGAAVQL